MYNRDTKKVENVYYQREMKRYWSHTYHTTTYLIHLYDFSLKENEKNIEITFFSLA